MIAAGKTSSEFKLALVSHVIGIAILAASFFWKDFPSEAARQTAEWIAGLLIAGPGAAYSMSRGSVKAAAAKRLAEMDAETQDGAP